MSETIFAPLLEQFGASLGIQGLCLDEQNSCMLSINSITLCLNWHESSRSLTVYAPVGGLEKNCSNDILRTLLAANCLGAQTGGFCLGLEDSLDMLFLSGQYISANPSAIELERFIQFFVDQAHDWSEKVIEITKNTAGQEMNSGAEQAEQDLPTNFAMLRI